MRKISERAVRAVLPVIIVICSLFLSGCGKRLVMTKGFEKDELFRVGNTRCLISEYNVFLLNLQKHCERTFGHGVWEGSEGGELRESIEQRALSEASRLKVMLLLAVQDNIMLTDSEESLADEAETEYYEGLSAEEREYLGIEEDTLRKLFEQYALAQKVYKSVGTSFEERYDSFCTTLDYDLNEKLWDTGYSGTDRDAGLFRSIRQVFREFLPGAGDQGGGRDRTVNICKREIVSTHVQ